MVDLNIYCDESRHTSDPSQPYLVIGAIECPRNEKREIVHSIHKFKALYSTQGEYGWKRISPNRQQFYWSILDLFASTPSLRFRCLVTNRQELDHDRFNDGDEELGFYKLYYQMLVHWLKPGNRYYIYLDWQQNKSQHRFSDLKVILQRRLSGRANIACLEPEASSNSPLIEMCDLLIGAVGYSWNGLRNSDIKRQFCLDLASRVGVNTLAASTSLHASKFNIFRFQGRRND